MPGSRLQNPDGCGLRGVRADAHWQVFENHGDGDGDSGRTRTPNLLIRSQLLYPVELRNHVPSDEDIISTGLISSAQICASFDIESPVADRRIPCPNSPARIHVCQPFAIMIVRGYAYAGPHKARAAYDQTVEGCVYVKDD